MWETAGETTRPSINDHISTGIGRTFVGEALFRMSSLLLEGGGEKPGFWRELGAAVISPPTGLNRLMFGERFRPVFPSHDPAIFLRLRVGFTLTTDVDSGGLLAQPGAGGKHRRGAGVDAGPSGRTDRSGTEVMNRGGAGVTVRVFGPHALSLSYLITTRDTRLRGRDRDQSVETVTLSCNFLGQRRFGAVDWRPGEIDR